MSSLISNPTPQFINPDFGNPCENAKIYIGKVNTDAMAPANRQDVYLMQWTSEATLNKVPLPQPLLTNSAGVIVYQGLPVTVWVDGAYSISVIAYDGTVLYESFYVDDPSYWLRLDLAKLPKKTADGNHYDPDDIHGVNMVGGAAPILSPTFTGDPRAPTPAAGDSDTTIATTAFVASAVNAVASAGMVGSFCWWLDSTPPANAVVCDGSQLSKAAYPDLYAIIGDQVAIANGRVPDSSSFYLPDFRGRYIRGIDNGAGRSSYAALFKEYEDLFKAHTHNFTRGGWNADSNDHDSDEGLWGNGTEKTQVTDSQGGAETMPKTIPLLPIVWAKKAAVNASSAALKKSSAPAVYHFDSDTGQYLSSSSAYPSPAEPGKWLTPANATADTPPEAKAGHFIVWNGTAWKHDAALFNAAEQSKAKAALLRQSANADIAEKHNRRTALNDWLKSQGAPFTLDDI